MSQYELYDVRGAKRFFQRGPMTIEAVGGVDLQIAPASSLRS